MDMDQWLGYPLTDKTFFIREAQFISKAQLNPDNIAM